LSEGEYADSLMPVNCVMLAVIAGIIGLVLVGFTGWHILLASRGQTTIECLEKTRYLSTLRKSMQHQGDGIGATGYGQQLRDIHTNALPGVTQLEEGEMSVDRAIPEGRHQSYDALERFRARERYEEYLDEQDSEKLPSAFDLGWRRNLGHLFGPKRLLWAFPICNTTGDGWSWEPSPKWLEAREKIGREREAQQLRERAAGWGAELSPQYSTHKIPSKGEGAGRHYLTSPSRPSGSRPPSKADRILGRDPSQYADRSDVRRSNTVSMQTLQPRRGDLDDDHYHISSDEDEAEQRALDRKAASGWPQKVGIATSSILGDPPSRRKDDWKGWDSQDDGVD